MNWKLVVGAACLVSLVGCDKNRPADDPMAEEAAETEEAAEGEGGSEEKGEVAGDDADAPEPIEGECVEDIKAHAVSRLAKKLMGEVEAGEIEGALQVRDFAEDLDGDGEPEKEAAYFAYAYNMEVVLYMSNSGCAVPVGDFMVTSLSPLEAEVKPGEIKGVQAWTKGGCAGLEGDLVTYAFDPAKKTYASTKTVSCGCDVEDPERDPLCPKP